MSSSSEAPSKDRFIIYERLLKTQPGSYKLWHAYLRERLDMVRNLPVTHPLYETLNETFERALVTMRKMPRVWIMYLQSLTEQKFVARTRSTFDRALCALPVTQHDRIWEPYLIFVSQKGIPIETSLRVHRRYLMFDPTHVEDFIEFLVRSCRWEEAADRLISVLIDEQFCSVKGKTKHQLWLELSTLLVHHANDVSGLNFDAIIRGEIRKFTDEVGILWCSLADYYTMKGLYEKARDIYEEGMMTVVTVRDYNVIFDAYCQFEKSMACAAQKLEMYDIYIARAAEIFGVRKKRKIHEQAIESGLPHTDVKIMSLKFAAREKSLGEIDRGRALFKNASQSADPRSDPEFWTVHDHDLSPPSFKFTVLLQICNKL